MLRARPRHFLKCVVLALALCAALLLPTAAGALAKSAPGTLTQLSGRSGCLVDRSVRKTSCAKVRALKGPGPFMGSRAIALSPNGRQVYVAASSSDAVAVLARNARTGTLSQASGAAGCVAAKGALGCASAIGLDGPNSVAVSPDGLNVYVTSRAANSVTTFRRNPKNGALRQLPPEKAGCISGLAVPGCANGRGLGAPDVVVVSADGKNVYVGSFFGNAVAAFSRDPSTGALTQLAGAAGCIAAEGVEGCTPGTGLSSVEGLAISADGADVYAAAATSNALVVLSRDSSTGALAQATDGTGCIVESPLTGCTTGLQLAGANAVAISPDDDDVYLTSLLSNSITSFTRGSTGALTQKEGAAGCLIFLRSAGCSFGRAISAPEGLAVSPDGRNVYVTAFTSGAIDVLGRGPRQGALAQKPGQAGCLGQLPDCTPARAVKGASSVALSPDGRYLYSTAFKSGAVDVFRRNQ